VSTKKKKGDPKKKQGGKEINGGLGRRRGDLLKSAGNPERSAAQGRGKKFSKKK